MILIKYMHMGVNKEKCGSRRWLDDWDLYIYLRLNRRKGVLGFWVQEAGCDEVRREKA